MKKWITFLGERTPLIPLVIASAGLTASSAALAGEDFWRKPIASIALFSFIAVLLFMLRLMDELRDLPIDRINHPERPLARGLIAEHEAKRMLVICTVILANIVPLVGANVLTQASPILALTLIVAWLMYEEFFMKKLLERNMFLHGILHQLIIIPLLAGCILMFLPEIPKNTRTLYSYGLLGFAAWLSLDIARKLGPDKARDRHYQTVHGKTVTVVALLLLNYLAWFGARMIGLGSVAAWFCLLSAGTTAAYALQTRLHKPVLISTFLINVMALIGPFALRLFKMLPAFAILLISSHGFSSETVFKFRISEDRGTFDWGIGEVNQDVILQMMEGLTQSDAKGKSVSAVAKSWKYQNKPEPKVIFKLNPDKKWSDGSPVCAQEFIEAWRRVLSPAFASPYAHLLFDVKGAKAVHSGKGDTLGLKANGCHELTVELEKPAAYFIDLTSHWVLFPIKNTNFKKPEELVVNGPFRVLAWKKDAQITLVKNERYAGTKPAIDRIEIMVVSDDATALNLFEQGKLDWIRDLPYLEKQRLSGRPDYRLDKTLVTYHVGFRMKGEAGELARDQRCALAAALDKNQIPKILKGSEVPLQPGFDLIKARKLWGAGPKGFEFHFYAKDIHVPLAEWMQAEWKKNLGIDVQLVKTEGKNYWSKLGSNPPAVFLGGTTLAFTHPYASLSEYESKAPANWGKYNSKHYDGLLQEIAASISNKSLVGKAEALAFKQDCAIIPLYQRQTASLLNNKWSGFSMNPLARAYLNQLRLK